MSTRTRHILMAVIVAAATLAVGARIWQVNRGRVTVPEEHHALGERVDLDGAFHDYIGEDTQGYSITVKSAERMTAADYLTRHAVDGAQPQPADETGDVIVLEIEATNTGNDDGEFDLIGAWVLGSSRDTFYRYDYDLWEHAEPNSKDAPGIKLRRDTTYTTYVPFGSSDSPAYFETFDKAPRSSITDRSFEFVLSNKPVRKLVDFTVS